MPGISSPDIIAAPTQEKVAVPKMEQKPIGQRAKEMIERIRARITRPNPNSDAALAEIATLPSPEQQNLLPQMPEPQPPTPLTERSLAETPAIPIGQEEGRNDKRYVSARSITDQERADFLEGLEEKPRWTSTPDINPEKFPGLIEEARGNCK